MASSATTVAATKGLKYVSVKKIGKIRVDVRTPIWSDWMKKKAERQRVEYADKEESICVQEKHEYYRKNKGGQRQSNKLKEFLLIFEAQKVLAKNGIKLSPQQYDCFKALLQAYSKGILGFELVTYEAYLSRKYGLVDSWDVLAFIMGRRFGKTYLFMLVESLMLSTQRNWNSNVFNVTGKVGHEIVLKGTEKFVSIISQEGSIKCKVLKSDQQFLVVRGHLGTDNKMFSSPGIQKNGGVSKKFYLLIHIIKSQITKITRAIIFLQISYSARRRTKAAVAS